MLWLILVAALSGLVTLYLLFPKRTRRRNEPPLDKGLIPWLGHALEFGKDAAKFLARMKAKHGDVFTVRVAGMYVTVLLDPLAFDSVLDDVGSLEVGDSRDKLLRQIFGLRRNGIKDGDERRFMEKHFHAANLTQLCTKMKTHTQNLLLNDFEDKRWRSDGLFSLCYSLLFRSGFLTLFGGEGKASAVYEEFRKFDDRVTKLARKSLKRDEKKLFTSAREKLWDLLSPKSLESESWHRDYIGFLRKEGVDAEMQTRALLLQLWTTQCNAGPAAFWLLGFLLTHPEAMEAVKSELRSLTPQDSPLESAQVQSPGAHTSTPVFDSVLSETLRLTAAVMINRDVVQDKSVHMADGREYLLRKGDKVCLFPFLSPQMNPEIHPQPQMFKFDRFLNANMTVKKAFYKNGRQLKHYTMPWGAGGKMCVGKEFAVFTIKQFVFLVLTHLDVELCEPGARLPPVDPSRFGFGMLQPHGELMVCCRRRTTQH
ncbi:prostacyclin synthase [Eucyclogobius newberryi]|uniref:prostacyclin synthase n=1 Tax=Eucyclogobius newberryi TaxID=166745 RepID=UPI003B59704C